jgi:hypothetical protein
MRATIGALAPAGIGMPRGTQVAVAAATGVCLFMSTTAQADGEETNRIAALEQQNVAMRKEIDNLRKSLDKNLGKNLATNQHPIAQTRPSRSTTRERGPASRASETIAKSDPFGAYAADLPATYKAVPVAEARGLLRLWGEGGATWTGGDPSLLFYQPIQPNPLLAFTPNAQSFDLKPKLGWEGAGGFDYRFANSPWHVSGQFRYGDGTAKGSFATSGGFATNLGSFNSSQAITADGKETHWLADMAIGRDVLGNGPDAMQVKAGLRISEFRASTGSRETDPTLTTFNQPTVFNGVTVSSIATTTNINLAQEARFLGAGPRVGIEGAVPFAGQWSFDYLGDAAVLFGTQRYSQIQTGSATASLTGIGPVNQPASFSSLDERSATVFNGDLQVGVSYWFTPNVKVSASYRLDAYLNVLTGLSPTNDTTSLQKVDRFIHGPRIGVTGQF